jgi:hypothetical protein
MLVRWQQVSRHVRNSSPGSEELSLTLEDARRRVGLRGRIEVRLMEETMSPAVCGWFRPVVLLPSALLETLSHGQLRSILIHELIHVRRADVWINGLQTLLQIAYWWHPLFWLANTRLRRLREEAVDDAVMLTLREDSGSYAPTLIEVAKLTLRRPMASLGLVGILESRNALRQRVERLLDFQPPRKAGLTLLSLFCVIGFAAVAVPMGEVPSKKEIPHSTADGIKVLPMPTADTNAVALDQTAAAPAQDTPLPTATPDASQTNQPSSARGLSSTNMDKVIVGEGSGNSQMPESSLIVKSYRIDFINMVVSLKVEPPVNPDKVFTALRDYVVKHGVKIEPGAGTSLFFNERNAALIFRAPIEEHEKLEKMLIELNGLLSGAQVNIKATFLEMPETAFANRFWKGLGIEREAFSNAPVILTLPQVQAARKAIDSMPGCDILACPEVTTLDGRQCQMKAADSITVVTNLNTRAFVAPGVYYSDLYDTQQIEVGPSLDVHTHLQTDNRTFQVVLIPTVVGFLGYGPPTNSVTVYVNGKKQKASTPIPRFSVAQKAYTVYALNHQTAVFDGMTSESIQVVKDKVPVLGDIPLLGRLFRSQSSTVSKKRQLLFVTFTLVDAAGKEL